jgi:HK97 family phage portal protein
MPRSWQSSWYGGNGVWTFSNGRFTTGAPDFRALAGDARQNSAVAACLGWIARTWPQARPVVLTQDDDGLKPDAQHPAARLLLRPSPFYTGKWLIRALLFDWAEGDAYAYIVPGEDGMPAELQYLPRQTITPVGNAQEMISGYEYRPDGQLVKTILPHEMIHLRHGINPNNPRTGERLLDSVDAEIATDNEATEWQWALLKNGGVPPWVIGPADSDKAAKIDEDDRDFIKAQMKEKTQGVSRGEGLVAPVAFKLDKMGFDPKSMVVGETQRKAEERIAAVIGIPPVVAGLGAGLDRATFANYEEARQAAWEDGIIPVQDDWADEFTHKLMPYYGEEETAYISYDRSMVRCLQDDESAKAEDSSKLFKADVIDRWSAKQRIGETPDETDKGVYWGSLRVRTDALPPSDPDTNDAGKGGATAPKRTPFGQRRTKAADPDAQARSLYDAVGRYRSALAKREASAVSMMESALRTAEADIQEEQDRLLGKIAAAMDSGGPIGESWLYQERRLASLLEQIGESYRRFARDTAPELAREQTAAARVAEEHTDALYRAALGPAPSGLTEAQAARAQVYTSFTVLPDDDLLETLVGFASDGSPLAEILARIGVDAVETVRNVLVSGVVRGVNPSEMAAELVGQLGVRRARALNIARTETLRAAREATRRMYEANAEVVSGWQWLSAADKRTCAMCWALHGQEFQTSERFATHPQCRCTLVPVCRSWADLLGDDSLPDGRPKIDLGEEIFADLPEEVQAAILGPGGMRLYQSGAPLSSWVHVEESERWGTVRREASLSEVETESGVTVGV